MPGISQVTATINVAVQGLNQLQQLSGLYTQTGNAAQRAQQQVNNTAQTFNTANKSATAFTGSIVKLTQSMVLFSVLLPLVRLPQTVMRSFQEFIQVGEEWQTSVRGIAAMAGVQGEAFNQLDVGLRNLANTYHLTTEEVGNSVKMIASTLDVLDRSAEATNGLTQEQNNLNDTLQLTDKIATLARASFSDLGEAQQVMFTVLATGRLTMDQANTAMEDIFKTVQVGSMTLSQFNSAGQRFLPFWEDWIQAATTTEARMNRLNDTMTAFATASLQLGPQRAATGFGQIAQALTKMTQPQLNIIQRMEALRRTKGLGEQYNVTPSALYSLTQSQNPDDMVELFTRLNNVLGQGSPIVQQYADRLEKLKKLTPEQAAAQRPGTVAEAAKQLQTQFLGSRTAQAAFEAITAPGKLEQITAEKAAATGTTAAMKMWRENPAEAANAVVSAYQKIQRDVFDAIQKDFVNVNAGIAGILTDVSAGLEGGQGGDTFWSKLQYIFKSLSDGFTKWYTSGGKADIASWGKTLGSGIAEAITDFFKGGEGHNMAFDAAKTFTDAFGEGMAQHFPEMLKAVMGSALTRAIATTVLLKGFPGVGLGTALAGGVATTALPSGGAATTGMNAGIIGLLAFLMGKNLIGGARAAFTGQAGVGLAQGGGAAGLFGRLFGQGQANAAAAAAAAGPTAWAPGMRYPAGTPGGLGGRFMPKSAFVPPAAPGILSKMGGVAKGTAGVSALFGALQLMDALQQPEGQRGGAVGTAIGSTVGGIGGAVLGSLLDPFLGPFGTIGGGLLGSMAGGFVGGKIGEAFGGQPAGQLATTGGSGLGPGTEAADDMTMVFINGLNNSDVAKYLLTIAREINVIGVSSKTAVPGGGSKSPVAVATSKAGLGAAMTNQYDTTSPLTKAQADAACGPAATAFFAKAYGRNPSLKEAYDLQSQLQGADISTTEGSNIVQMGKAIEQMGAPAGEVYQGANIDWGRMAENAKKGIPDIVNIGPNKQTGWPGHFFQIGGWNPDTNQFYVGSSGSNLKGGKEWMTPQEMMAFGPAMGAIYGTQATNLPAITSANTVAKAAGTGGAVDPSTHAAFVKSIMPYAQQAAKTLGVDPNWLVAMAASESNWGAAPGNELFGMKGTGTAGQVNLKTWELVNGQKVQTTAPFAAYNTPGEAFDAYTGLLQKNYPEALNTQSLAQFTTGLKAGGYYTDTQQHYQATLEGLVKQVQELQGSGAGPGTGMGPGGGGINIGTLIGTVNLSGSATQDDADQLAGMIADALEQVMNTSGGGVIGQNKIFKQ